MEVFVAEGQLLSMQDHSNYFHILTFRFLRSLVDERLYFMATNAQLAAVPRNE
jgi:hypothetical protein